MNNIIHSPLKQRRVLSIVCMGAFLFVGTASYSTSVSSAEKIPAFMQKNLNKAKMARGKGCPEGLEQQYKILWSPVSGTPSAAPHIVLPGITPRKFDGVNAYLNKTLTHTFNTRKLTAPCCMIKEGWFYMNQSRKLPEDIWSGNAFSGGPPAGDGFMTNPVSTPGISFYPNPPFTNNSSTVYPNFNWGSPLHLTSSQLINGGTFKFSYAVGDDTNVKRTAILARTCCIRKYRPHGKALKNSASSRTTNKFLQMMKSDKGKGQKPISRSGAALQQKFQEMKAPIAQ